MSHFTDSDERSTATPPEWLKVGAQIGDLVNEWSTREDVIAFVGPGAGGNAPACFKPTIAEMEINVNLAFADGIDPNMIENITERRVQFDWPEAAGAILHEAMHARHSLWSFEELNRHERPMVRQLAVLFEEGRIEARGVSHYPKNRSFLRSCALGIVLKETDPEEIAAGGWMGLSQIILLTLARVDAGVLDADDVEPVRNKARELLGDDLLERLRRIWTEAQAHADDTDVQPLLRLAERWLDEMKEDDKDPEAQSQEAAQAMAEMLGDLAETLGDMAVSAALGGAIEAAEQAGREHREEEVRAKEAVAREEAEHRKAAEELWGGKNSFGRYNSTDSELVRKRKPTDKERAAAANIGRQLEKAKYHDRIVTEHHSEVPPGRIRMQAVMQGGIERSRGAVPTVKPFKSKRRHHAIDDDLIVGCLVDISGSMGGAMEPMGVTAWLMAEMARRIQARFAQIYYGNSIFPVLRSGQRLDEVRIYSASDGTEEFESAFKALDGELNLLHGVGARLLIIVSDMAYRTDMRPKAKRWVQRCSESGVAVIILPYDDGSYALPYGKIPGVEIVKGYLDPVTAAGAIGAAAVKALNAASR